MLTSSTLTRGLLIAALLVPVFYAHADSKLDAKIAEYLEDTRSAIAEKCNGLNLELEVNLTAVDASAWAGKGGKKREGGDSEGELRVPRHVIASLASPCKQGLETIYQLCTSNSNAEAWRPVIAREVKKVSCVSEGFVRARPGETSDVHLRKNISFAGGVLTLRMDDSVETFNENVTPVLMAALAKKEGAPKVRADILKTGENGESCRARSDCRTGVCAAGTCHFCDAKNKCASGLVCDEGYCWTREELDKIAANRAARASEPSKAPQRPEPAVCRAKPTGAACKFGSECCSKICKASYTCK